MDLKEGSMLHTISEGLISYQKKFIEHYNNSENKIAATTELISIKDGLSILSFNKEAVNNKLEGLEELLDYEIMGITESDVINADLTVKRNCCEDGKILEELKYELVDRIYKDIKDGNLISNPKEAKNHCYDILDKFYHLSGDELHKEKVTFLIDSIYDDAEKGIKKVVMESVLELLLQKIYNDEFPGEIDFYEHLRSAQTFEMTSALGNPIFKENKWEAPEGFYKRATEIKQDNPNFGQEGLYTQLMDEFFCDKSSENEKPSFSTVRRRLKSKEII